MGDDSATTKTMRLRYAGTCRDCGTALAAGTTAVYDRETRTVRCVTCPPVVGDAIQAATDTPLEPGPVESGTAGGSARREFQRRHDKREARIREAHPHIGGFLLAISDDPQSTSAWAAGARGEEALGRTLDALAVKGARLLHDRRIRGTRANIDHIAVTPSGVHVIDAKRYAGKRPKQSAEVGFFKPRVERLMVGSSDRTRLVEGMHEQVAKVRAALDAAGFADVPVTGTLCFIDADWPLFGGSFTVNDVAVLSPRALTERLTSPGTLDAARIDLVHRALADVFPVA